MKLQKNFIKKISCLLIISLLSLNLTFLTVPKKAEAQWAVFDGPIFAQLNIQYAKKIAENFLSQALKAAALKIIKMMTQATVDWINNGFEGNPAYVSNLGDFLTGEGGVADQTIGDFFANEPGLAFLCEPFQLQVKLALQLGLAPSLKEQIGCTFTQVTENVENAVNNVVLVDGSGNKIGNLSNFTGNGGWDAWLKTTLQPQNNPVGAYMIAKAGLDAKTNEATDSKTKELVSTGFALSYKRCVDTYIDYKTGKELGKSEEYTEGFNKPNIPKELNAGTSGKFVYAKASCTVKTPGSAIADLVSNKATSDSRNSEYMMAFSDSIDAIFNALFNVFVNSLFKQLKDGVLTSSDNNYNDAILDNATQNLYNNYLNNINNLNDNLLNSTTSGIDIYNFSTSTFGYNYSTSSTAETETNYGSNALDRAKNNANNLINSLMKSELTYQNNYLTAKNILTSAQNVFASSSECNMKANKSGSMLRAFMINSNVIENIKGTIYTDNYRILAQIPWNLVTIKTAVSNSTEKIAILNEASSKVSLAGSIDEVKDVLIPVNSTSFNTDPQITMVTNIKTWLSGVQNMYNTEMCPIDLIKVMEIVSPATSTASN